jgi:perosamine synthetase
MVGYNYRMTDLQGAVGVVQIKKLDQFIDERDVWANYYTKQFSDLDWVRTPKYSDRYKHGWQSYVLFIDETKAPKKRNEIMEFLQQNGVSTRPGTHAVHMLDFYKNTFNIKEKDFPGAYAANEYSMSIPLHNKMVAEDYEYVVSLIKNLK